MSTPLPFEISSEAEPYIREHCTGDDLPDGMEPSLGLVWGYEMKDPNTGIVSERFHEEHYRIGFSPPARHRDFQYLTIAGHRLAMHPHTIDGLRGRCLSLQNVVVSLSGPEKRSSVLIATLSLRMNRRPNQSVELTATRCALTFPDD